MKGYNMPTKYWCVCVCARCQVYELTDICTSGLIAQCQHCADSLGVSLLHQQLNDCLAVGLNQVLTLRGQRFGQICAHLLHSLNHFLLKQKRESARHPQSTVNMYSRIG